MLDRAFISITYAILKRTCRAIVYWFKPKLIIFMQKIIGHTQCSILPKIDVSKGLRTQYLINCDIKLQVSTETIKKLYQGLRFV